MQTGGGPRKRTSTERLDLAPPVEADVDEWFADATDPRLWRHFPSGRPTRREAAVATLHRIADEWGQVGLGAWTVRRRGLQPVIGYGGCSLRMRTFWNLSYRLAAEAHGAGLATELATEAVRRANVVRPDAPVLALLLEHNLASAGVAQKVGLTSSTADRTPATQTRPRSDSSTATASSARATWTQPCIIAHDSGTAAQVRGQEFPLLRRQRWRESRRPTICGLNTRYLGPSRIRSGGASWPTTWRGPIPSSCTCRTTTVR